MDALDQNTPARRVPLNEDELALVKGLQLLTMKPMIYAANVPEGDLADEGGSNPHVRALRGKAAEEGCEVIIVSAQVGGPIHACCMGDLCFTVEECPLLGCPVLGMQPCSVLAAYIRSEQGYAGCQEWTP
jgi:hypothetical protein